MKRAAFILTMLFLQIAFSGEAQEQTIQLKLNEGYEYIFERIEKRFSHLQNGSDRVYDLKKKRFKITVDEVVSDEEMILGLTLLENKEENPSSQKTDITDYFFPGFHENRVFSVTNPYEPLFCMFKIQVLINLNSRKITIAGRESLLNKFNSRLIEQGYDDEDRQDIIDYINHEKLNKHAELVSFLLWFHNTRINSENLLINCLVDDKLIVRESGDKFIRFGEQDFSNLTPGRWYKKYWLNTENGIITDYSTIKMDVVENLADSLLYNARWNVQEIQLKLRSCKKIQPETVTLSGKIENPLSNKVHIRFLEEPFGMDLKTVTTFLRKDGSFEITFPFTKKGLIYFENENNNKHNAPGTVIMYAKPGDSLGFEATGEKFPWNVKFSGDRTAESSLLLELRNELKLKDKYFNQPSLIFDTDLLFGVNYILNDQIRQGKFSSNIGIDQLFEYITLTDKIVSKYKESLDGDDLMFISNEVKSYLKNGIYILLNSLNRMSEDDFYSTFEIENIEEIDSEEIRRKSEKIDAISTYNEYGLESRKCMNSYLEYHYRITNRFTFPGFGIRIESFKRFRDIEQVTQYARMLINGSPLYREIASQLYEDISFPDNYPYNRSFYSLETANRYLQLIIRNCNDIDVVEKAKHLHKQQQKMKSGTFVPDIKFIDLNNHVTPFHHFKGKPTVFHITTSWYGQRFLIEEYVKENSHINFVIANEGSNFREWKEYTTHAEPVAKHLFFINDSITFKELFLAPDVFLVFDKKGNFISYEKGLGRAFKKAEASLSPQEKEIDRSTLRIIILVLGFLLLAITLTLLTGRWRARQRFRKEQQSRRLRELELTAIRSQMNPHFLFNSLNSVQNLIQQNKGKEAHVYLSDFAGLIRKVLKNSEKHESALAEELEMTEQYLKLEKLRFDFDYTVFVDEGIDIQNTMVPSMLLQPFAENAVIHGLQNKHTDRKLKIEVFKIAEGIKIVLEDNGIGREAARKIEAEKNGKGIKMNEERLDLLREKYGEKYRLEIIDLEEGTRVEITIPEEK